MPEVPRIVAWADHALVKAQLLGIARSDVEDAVLEGHPGRSKNTGAADWLVVSGRLAIAYNHPVDGDELAALIVTLWRRG
jgi:hypothetical protein